MLNSWGDPLTDALQADKAGRDRELEEAREVARALLKRLLLFADAEEYVPRSVEEGWETKYPWLKEQP